MPRKHRRKVEWISADVRCPYYFESCGNEIQCEGFGRDMTVTVSFRSKAERLSYMGAVCCGPYDGCPYCIANDSIKYK
jgi:hypothetical protein